ncbi:DNA polymerase III subunit delta [Sphingomicrobium sp. XHP0235]|uniref:DNA polymerase III subunit delta n=1 Tax=Sphingomicrobium aquimarinum TaxID=3133971 RepID=UPI0031FE5942
MKAKGDSFSKFLGRSDPLRLYLFYGADTAGSHALATRLAEHLGGERTRLEPSALKSDPGRIVDEAAGAGLFGDGKLIWVEPVGNDFLGAAEALLGTATTDFPVIAIAGTLTKASKLLKRVEADKAAVAVVSYPPDLRSLTADIETQLQQRGLVAAEGVAARLAESCDLNRDIARQEIEKLQLYAGEEHAITHEQLDAIGADYGDTEWFGLGDAALLGDVSTLETAFGTLSPQGTEATTVLRALQRRIQMLAPLGARVARGESAEGVVASMGRALYGKDRAIVPRLLKIWSGPRLARLAERVAAAERAAMLNPAARKAALGEELLAIARIGARKA